jgi:plasmid stability protein
MVGFVEGAKMAQLVLENVNPAIVQKLELRARRSGRTVEAEALQLIEAEIDAGECPADTEIDVAPTPLGAEPSPREAAAEPDAIGGGSTGASAIADRQAALAGAYPNEYVILVGDRVLVHTGDKEKAYAEHDAALDRDEKPIIMPPGVLRRIPPPIVRGRSLARASGARR